MRQGRQSRNNADIKKSLGAKPSFLRNTATQILTKDCAWVAEYIPSRRAGSAGPLACEDPSSAPTAEPTTAAPRSADGRACR